MPAGLVVAANPTYRPEALSILGLAPEDEFPIALSSAGFAFSAWLPDGDFLRRVYDEVVDHDRTVTQELWYRQFLLDVAARLLEAAGRTNTPLRALDYGCGYGGLLDLLACRELVGVGYEPSGAKREATGGRVTLVGSADEIAERGPFDLLICTEVLEHMAKPQDAIAMLRANAKPGAVLLVTVPCCTTPEMRAALDGFASGAPQPFMFNPWEHLNYFRPTDLRGLLAQGGFQPFADLGRLRPARLALGATTGGDWRSDLVSALRAGKRLLSAATSTQLLCRAVG
jgi:SAM-dependent methyltransferase